MLLQSGSIVYAWDSLELTGKEAAGARDASGRMVTMERTVAGLQPDTAYVARIKVFFDFNEYFLLLFVTLCSLLSLYYTFIHVLANS